LKAVVLMRAVPDTENAGPGAPRLVLDPSSLTALGLALGWKRSQAGANITAVAAGPIEWEPLLREALALGADAACRVATSADYANGIATDLAAIGEECSLVFAGAASSDYGSGALPGMLAESLGWPLLAEVLQFEAQQGQTLASVRETASIRLRYLVTPPAVVVAASLPPPPLYPPLARRLAARRATIDALSPSVPAGESPLTLLGFGPGKPRTRHLLRPEEGARPGDRLRQLMGGGRSGASSRLEAGGDLAGRLLEVLLKEGLVSRD
jgi:electron transfer flavoprotein beta subunit